MDLSFKGGFLAIKLDYWGRVEAAYSGNEAEMILTDLTTGEQVLKNVFNFSMPPWHEPGSITYELDVDPTHDYGLAMAAVATAHDAACWYTHISAVILPEPATACFLLMGFWVLTRTRH